jgi:hypothetical protein
MFSFFYTTATIIITIIITIKLDSILAPYSSGGTVCLD